MKVLLYIYCFAVVVVLITVPESVVLACW